MVCFGCYQKFIPRWKSLLIKIYPRDPALGLRKAYMEKLMYYVAKNPEKVDKMGKFIQRRLVADLSRRRYDYCKLTLEAVDEMLRRVSDSHALNMLAGPYLEMIKALLEERDAARLWLIASESFAKFANIPEDTPSHHRTCDFLIERFTALCFFSDSSSDIDFKRVRVAGVKGIRGVIRKTMKDTLQQTSFWNQNSGETHLGKMVPALIYNIEISFFSDNTSVVTDELESVAVNEEPGSVASDCFKELIGNVPYTHLKHLLDPLLAHLDQDNNRLWRVAKGEQFATHILKIVINHVKEQSCHIVVEAVLEHLQKHCRVENANGTPRQPSDANVRTAIANVFRICILLVSATLTNPSSNEILRKLVSILQRSVLHTRVRNEVSTLSAYDELRSASCDSTSTDDEASFQLALLNAISEFAISVQDFQKIQLMEFILKRVNEFDMQQPSSGVTIGQLTAARGVFRKCMLETVLKMALTYETRTLGDALTRTLLDVLLQLAALGATDAHASLHAEKILLCLIDRSHNRELLLASQMRVYRSYDQVAGGSARDSKGLVFPTHAALNDTFFMQNHVDLIFRKMVTIAVGATSVEHFEHIHAILTVLYLEIAQFDFVTDFYRLLLALQAAAMRLTVDSELAAKSKAKNSEDNDQLADESDANQISLIVFQRCSLHSMVASLFSLSACVMNEQKSKRQNQSLLDYVLKVVDSRSEKAPFLLPDVACNRLGEAELPDSLEVFESIDEYLFDAERLQQELRACGIAKANSTFTLSPPIDWVADAERQFKASMLHPENRPHFGASTNSDTQSINSELSSIEATLIEPQVKLVSAAGAAAPNAYTVNFENRPEDEEDAISIGDMELFCDDDLQTQPSIIVNDQIASIAATKGQSPTVRPTSANSYQETSQNALETLKQNKIANLLEAQRAASTKRYEILDKLLAVGDDVDVQMSKKFKEDGEDEFPNLFMY